MMPCFAVAFCFLQNFDVGEKKEYREKGKPGEGDAGDLGHMLPAGLAFVHTW